ncbi:subtilase family protein [Kribbella orskensis]|uniref:Subtilase family protein n=1 Tax=Kribbella orskensis TaxID=2512216 RepID=A0ABY2BL02_9ACTN|nr:MULTISPECIES: S8 family serine peptidase [Kribbella]TCN40399.1 subtilase family protein [Kribbella sp. VKM Ac-2500]TCO23019.1 subtilase family protein [Kribbella orskensis]
MRKLPYLLTSVVLIVPVLVATAVPTASAGPTVAAAPSAPSKIPTLLRDSANLAAAAAKAKTSQADPKARSLGIDSSGRIGVQLYAAAPVTAQQEATLASLGVSVLKNTADFKPVPGAELPATGLVSTTIPYDKLDAVAALGWVTALRPSLRPAVDVGPITAEGVQLHKADAAQARGLTGRGQKIGAISGDVDHLAESVAQGELPANVQVLRQAEYVDDEGTAMLEIIHDLAPQAKLAYASTRDTTAEYVEAFHELAAAGVTMIAEDIALDDDPVFQQGIGAATAEGLAKHGIWVSSSAGNLGNRHAPRVTATGTGSGPDGAVGPFTGCPNAPDNVVKLRGADTTYDLNLLPGAAILPTLQWSEPRAVFPTAGQGGFTDLNLYLVDATGTRCLASSTAVQADGVGDTIEQFIYQNTTGVAQPAKLVVDVQGTSSARKAPILDLRWRALSAGVQTIDPPERAGSMNPDSNYLGFATSAGAVNASLSVDPATIALEPFSAAGPTQIVTTTRCPGGMPGPCRGVSGPLSRSFPAPYWVAADGVSVSGVGPFGSGTCPTAVQGQCRFFGTSASAPTAAGVAALTRQEFGGHIHPVALNAILAARSVDRPGAAFGAGVLSAR